MKHKKKKHKQLFAESPKTEQVDEKEGSKHKRKKSHKKVIAEYAETEQIVDEKGDGLTLHWPQHNIYVNCHTQLQTKVMLFFPVHSSHRLQK